MEAAGSVAASDSRSGQQPHHQQQQQQQQQQNEEEEESMLQGGGSVNWGQAAGAHSPRVPRSQISRAHPAAGGGGYGERTSAVLSALSGDDETALSAAEAAGEHTSEPQEAVGCVGEAQGEAMGTAVPGGGAAAAAAASTGLVAGAPPVHPHLHSHHLQQQLPALSLTAPAPRGRGGFEIASSPPASTSPIYRANSVVSYTAAPAKGGQQQQQRRGADTPASAPAAAQILGTSPNTSRGEFASALPRAARRGAAFSSGLPPTSGQRPGSAAQHHAHHHQHYHLSAAAAAAAAAMAGPSRPSLSGTQSHAATAGAGGAAAQSMPSTLAVALGPLSPPDGGPLLGNHVTPSHGGLGLPMPQAPTSLAGLLPYAASLGLQPSQLGSMAAALLAQSSALGAQHQQQQQQSAQGLQQGQAQQGQHHAGGSGAGAVMPTPPPLPLQQQVEALQNMAAMLQAQASAMMSGTAGVQAAAPAALQQPAMGTAGTPGSGTLSPTAGAAAQQQQQQQHGGEVPVASMAGQAHAATSQGAASVHSLPSLMGASAIQGHPLPPPFHRAGGATTPAPLQSFGGTPAPPAAAAAAPATVQSGAFAAPGPLAATATTPLPAVPAVSEMQGSAMQPALAALLQHAQQGVPLPSHDVHTLAALAGPLQQATSAVLGSRNGGGGGGGGGGSGGSQPHRPSSADPQQAAADEERRRHAGDRPQPQAATIQEVPTADVAAASQGGGMGGPPGMQLGLPLAVPQEAAMLGGNSAFGDAMELGGDEEDDDAMEVQQEAAGGSDEGQGGHLPPAPHGAASVMATLMTENGGGGERSEGNDEDMVQQAASGPSRTKAAAAQPAQSLSRSRVEPAAATAHNTGAPSTHAAATQPSQQGPAPSNQGQLVHGPSSLATVSTGNGQRAGGSVEMGALPTHQQAQHATSAPAGLPPGGGGEQAETVSHAAGGVGLPAAAAAAAYPAASAPAAVPLQLQHQQHAGLGAGLAGQQAGARPAASASVSGQGDTPGVLWQHNSATGGCAALPQSSAAVASLPLAGAAALAAQQAHGYGGNHVPLPAAVPAYASMCEGQNDGAPEPRADARSRSLRAGAAAGAAPAPAPATIEGMGSPTASRHMGRAHESQGTARATILAGAAHSILTTAAAGEAEAMDEGGEALSPLLTAKAFLTHGMGGHAQLADGPAHAHGAAAAGTGSVGGALQQPAFGDGEAAGAAPLAANGVAGQHEASLSLQHDGMQQAGSPGFASPIDLSTMAVDLAPPAGALDGTADQPQPSASFQPSSLPPPGAVAAALEALEQQQAALNGGMYTPPSAAAEQLGELYHALQQQNGHATHASSVIGNNGRLAQSSPDRELTSPSRLVTHDSTGSGSRQQHSKHTSKRRRTSAGPAGSSQHA